MRGKWRNLTPPLPRIFFPPFPESNRQLDPSHLQLDCTAASRQIILCVLNGNNFVKPPKHLLKYIFAYILYVE